MDASAVLAVLNEEPGAELVTGEGNELVISTVNLSEVTAKLANDGTTAASIVKMLGELELDVRPFTADLAYAAGYLRPLTRQFGLSLGDRACLALAQELGLPALTTDRAWQNLQVGVQVRLIR